MSEIKIIVMVLLVIANSVAFAQSSAPSQILIQNVQVFDGTSTSLSAATDVLMPGLIESHVHLSFAGMPIGDLLTSL